MMDSTNDQTQTKWKIAPRRVVSIGHPFLVGILNVTPDSFSDGGELNSVELAVDRARAMVDDGADMLDTGGESTRPGAARVEIDEQIRRVVPVIEAMRTAGITVPISVDTTQGLVASAAIDAGADAINDVSAGGDDSEMFTLASDRKCGLILMHRAALPEVDQYSDQYDQSGRPIGDDVVGLVVSALAKSRNAAMAAGVDAANIVLDPGLGFGKDVGQNLELIRSTQALAELGHPVMSALSRKSFVGRLSLGRDSDPSERLAGTLALSVLHLQAGARLFRVHDVLAHRQALDAAWALFGQNGIRSAH